MTHKTKGIVLRTVKYGETSIILSVFTELFGMQSYIVKGVRAKVKQSQSKASYFQPGALLDMVVYHNELKHIQFIKEFQWSYLYQQIYFDITKNAVAQYMVELLLHSIRQPETNPDLFYFIENGFIALDVNDDTATANLPLIFTLQLAKELGFQVQGVYSAQTPVLDLQEGMFVREIPFHPYYSTEKLAAWLSQINQAGLTPDQQPVLLSRHARKELLQLLQQFMRLHLPDFGELKSLRVLEEIVG